MLEFLYASTAVGVDRSSNILGLNFSVPCLLLSVYFFVHCFFRWIIVHELVTVTETWIYLPRDIGGSNNDLTAHIDASELRLMKNNWEYHEYWPLSIDQYSNMAPKLSDKLLYWVVFSLYSSLFSILIEEQKKLNKFAVSEPCLFDIKRLAVAYH